MNTGYNNNNHNAGGADAAAGFRGPLGGGAAAMGVPSGGGGAAAMGVPSGGGGAGVGHGVSAGVARNLFSSPAPTPRTHVYGTPGVTPSTMAGGRTPAGHTPADFGLTRNTGGAMNQQMGQGIYGRAPTLDTQDLFNAQQPANCTRNFCLPLDKCYVDISSRILAGNARGKQVLRLCCDDVTLQRDIEILKSGGVAAQEKCAEITSLRRDLVDDVQEMKNSVADMDTIIADMQRIRESKNLSAQQAESVLVSKMKEFEQMAYSYTSTGALTEQPRKYDKNTVDMLLHKYNSSGAKMWLNVSLKCLADDLFLNNFDKIQNLDVDGCYNLLEAFGENGLLSNSNCKAAVETYKQNGTIVDTFSASKVYCNKQLHLETLHALVGIYLDKIPEDHTGMVRRNKRDKLPTWGNHPTASNQNMGPAGGPMPATPAPARAPAPPTFFMFGNSQVPNPAAHRRVHSESSAPHTNFFAPRPPAAPRTPSCPKLKVGNMTSAPIIDEEL
ncbi:expressed unknown protein [Seminavis robusta]|uniref:Uncharacterized protein n=1 Tax=Seminavis robusta TaxID=568900 RepID=A0A9N8E9Z0_9STRA|nr:expressed unknown protein [Seminavis robusta]|eukprot:Sro788_g202620.1 n/a (499) ;mRNA; r:46002-47498